MSYRLQTTKDTEDPFVSLLNQVGDFVWLISYLDLRIDTNTGGSTLQDLQEALQPHDLIGRDRPVPLYSSLHDISFGNIPFWKSGFH